MRQERDMVLSISLQTFLPLPLPRPHLSFASFESRTIHSGCCRWFQAGTVLVANSSSTASGLSRAVKKYNEASKHQTQPSTSLVETESYKPMNSRQISLQE
jgi:hypothetical protein